MEAPMLCFYNLYVFLYSGGNDPAISRYVLVYMVKSSILGPYISQVTDEHSLLILLLKCLASALRSRLA